MQQKQAHQVKQTFNRVLEVVWGLKGISTHAPEGGRETLSRNDKCEPPVHVKKEPPQCGSSRSRPHDIVSNPRKPWHMVREMRLQRDGETR